MNEPKKSKRLIISNGGSTTYKYKYDTWDLYVIFVFVHLNVGNIGFNFTTEKKTFVKTPLFFSGGSI
jgi:hypothetical protein